MPKADFKQFGSGSYKQLRASGMSHSEAFSRVGTILQSKISSISRVRAETKLIKSIDGFNKNQVRKFAEKFDRGEIEKDKFLASNNNEPMSYADEIGGFKRKEDPEREARKEFLQRKAIMNSMGKWQGNTRERKKGLWSFIDKMIVSGQYKVENGEIKIGGLAIK